MTVLSNFSFFFSFFSSFFLFCFVSSVECSESLRTSGNLTDPQKWQVQWNQLMQAIAASAAIAPYVCLACRWSWWLFVVVTLDCSLNKMRKDTMQLILHINRSVFKNYRCLQILKHLLVIVFCLLKIYIIFYWSVKFSYIYFLIQLQHFIYHPCITTFAQKKGIIQVLSIIQIIKEHSTSSRLSDSTCTHWPLAPRVYLYFLKSIYLWVSQTIPIP